MYYYCFYSCRYCHHSRFYRRRVQCFRVPADYVGCAERLTKPCVRMLDHDLGVSV